MTVQDFLQPNSLISDVSSRAHVLSALGGEVSSAAGRVLPFDQRQCYHHGGVCFALTVLRSFYLCWSVSFSIAVLFFLFLSHSLWICLSVLLLVTLARPLSQSLPLPSPSHPPNPKTGKPRHKKISPNKTKRHNVCPLVCVFLQQYFLATGTSNRAPSFCSKQQNKVAHKRNQLDTACCLQNITPATMCNKRTTSTLSSSITTQPTHLAQPWLPKVCGK